jgi:glycine cleavage system aminomethyltransferase T
MKAALLPDRGVVKVAGDGARSFLNRLFTADIGKVTRMRRALPRCAPQGKIIVDAIIGAVDPSEGAASSSMCPARWQTASTASTSTSCAPRRWSDLSMCST